MQKWLWLGGLMKFTSLESKCIFWIPDAFYVNAWLTSVGPPFLIIVSFLPNLGLLCRLSAAYYSTCNFYKNIKWLLFNLQSVVQYICCSWNENTDLSHSGRLMLNYNVIKCEMWISSQNGYIKVDGLAQIILEKCLYEGCVSWLYSARALAQIIPEKNPHRLELWLYCGSQIRMGSSPILHGGMWAGWK